MMRWRGFLIAIMLATAPAAPAVAQTATAAEQAAALAGPWRGIWHRDDPYYQYAGVMTLTPKAGGRVEGAISWTLRRSASRITGTTSPLGAATAIPTCAPG